MVNSMLERGKKFEEGIEFLERNYKGEKINTTDFVKKISGKEEINQHWLIEASMIFKRRGWSLVHRKIDNNRRMWIFREPTWG